MFRRSAAVLLGSSLTSFLLGLALTTALVTTFTGANVKDWLKDHNVYQNLVDSILKESQDTNVASAGNEVNINQPEAKEAIKNAITPEFLQTTTEQFIDGTEPWLQGKIEKPSFSIDISGVKTSIAENIAAAARQRYLSLPLCARGQIPSTNNPLEVECRVAGLDIEASVAQLKNDVLSSSEFLPNPVITADNFSFNNKDGVQKQEKPFQDSNVPKIYQWLRRGPIIFGVLSLLAAAALILLGHDKRKAFRQVGISLLFASLLIAAASAIGSAAFTKARESLESKDVGNGEVILKESALPVVDEIKQDFVKTLLVFAIAFFVIFAAITAYLLFTKNKHKNTPDQTLETPKPKPQADSGTKNKI